MSYTYKFIPASIEAEAKKGSDPKSSYRGLFEETLEKQFYNSSNWWTISEETSVGSQEYEDVDVRINQVINSETGLKVSDDWKTLLFMNIDHDVELGKYYVFEDNYWLTINEETYKTLSNRATIRRCNNTLRWIDTDSGSEYDEPCIIDYMVKEPRDYYTQGSPFKTPGGFLHIDTQFNDRTKVIKENQRFLFGNPEKWICYRVVGTGLNPFRNTQTTDNTSPNVLTIDLIADFVNEQSDDIVNGIADVYTQVYSVTLSASAVEGSAGSSIDLDAYVTYNENTVSRTMEWSTSSSSIASVDATGLITFVSTGSAIITANIENNNASGSCIVTVSASPVTNKIVVLNPHENYVLEGDTKSYSVYLYENGVVQADEFTFTVNSNDVPTASYTFTETSGNTFTLKNNVKDVSSYLTITCTTIDLSATKSFDIYLRGAWLNDIIS